MVNYKPDLSCQSKFIPIDLSAQIILQARYILSHLRSLRMAIVRKTDKLAMVNCVLK